MLPRAHLFGIVLACWSEPPGTMRRSARHFCTRRSPSTGSIGTPFWDRAGRWSEPPGTMRRSARHFALAAVRALAPLAHLFGIVLAVGQGLRAPCVAAPGIFALCRSPSTGSIGTPFWDRAGRWSGLRAPVQALTVVHDKPGDHGARGPRLRGSLGAAATPLRVDGRSGRRDQDEGHRGGREGEG